MAAPPDITLNNLQGTWKLNKLLSSDPEPLLALQGMNWILRRGILMSNIILKVRQYEEAAPGQDSRTRLEISQRTTSGLPGTSEDFILDWSDVPHDDHIFGKTTGRSRYIRGSRAANGKIYPDIDSQVQITDDIVEKFLKGEIMEDKSDCEGFLVEEPGNDNNCLAAIAGEGVWVHLFVRSQDSKWQAEQIWGFETIHGERRWVRRTVVTKDGKFKLGRVVYDFDHHDI